MGHGYEDMCYIFHYYPCGSKHYYRTCMLSQLGTGFSLGFPTETTLSRQKTPSFGPGWHNRDKKGLCIPVEVPNRDKRERKKIEKETFLLILLAVLRLDHHSSLTSTPSQNAQLPYKHATPRRNFRLNLDTYSSHVTITQTQIRKLKA